MISSWRKKIRPYIAISIALPIAIAIVSAINPARAAKTTSGIFSSTGSMNVARARHTSTLLNTGEVLVAQGVDVNGNALTSAELFDPVNHKWRFTGSMNDGRASGTATLLQNGEVLVTGGDDQFATVATAELYNPATGQWTSTGSMSIPRCFHTATLLANGKVLVVGGKQFCGQTASLGSAELYDPATGTWQTTGSLNVARDSALAELLPNGQVLVAGGEETAANGTSTQLASAELFNPLQASWSFTGSLPAPGQRVGSLLSNGDVLFSGHAFYTPATGTGPPQVLFQSTILVPPPRYSRQEKSCIPDFGIFAQSIAGAPPVRKPSYTTSLAIPMCSPAL